MKVVRRRSFKNEKLRCEVLSFSVVLQFLLLVRLSTSVRNGAVRPSRGQGQDGLRFVVLPVLERILPGANGYRMGEDAGPYNQIAECPRV